MSLSLSRRHVGSTTSFLVPSVPLHRPHTRLHRAVRFHTPPPPIRRSTLLQLYAGIYSSPSPFVRAVFVALQQYYLPLSFALSACTLRLPGSDRLTLSNVSPPSLPLSLPPSPFAPLATKALVRANTTPAILAHLVAPSLFRSLPLPGNFAIGFPRPTRRDAHLSLLLPLARFFLSPSVPLCSPALAFCLALAVSIISRFSHCRHERSVSVVFVPGFSRRIMYT